MAADGANQRKRNMGRMLDMDQSSGAERQRRQNRGQAALAAAPSLKPVRLLRCGAPWRGA